MDIIKENKLKVYKYSPVSHSIEKKNELCINTSVMKHFKNIEPLCNRVKRVFYVVYWSRRTSFCCSTKKIPKSFDLNKQKFTSRSCNRSITVWLGFVYLCVFTPGPRLKKLPSEMLLVIEIRVKTTWKNHVLTFKPSTQNERAYRLTFHWLKLVQWPYLTSWGWGNTISSNWNKWEEPEINGEEQ